MHLKRKKFDKRSKLWLVHLPPCVDDNSQHRIWSVGRKVEFLFHSTRTETVEECCRRRCHATTYFAFLDNIVEEFSTRNIFHDHEYICRCADHLISTYVRVSPMTISSLFSRWSYNLMMCGCRKRRRFWISLLILPTTSNCFIFVRLTILMATVCLVNWW